MPPLDELLAGGRRGDEDSEDRVEPGTAGGRDLATRVGCLTKLSNFSHGLSRPVRESALSCSRELQFRSGSPFSKSLAWLDLVFSIRRQPPGASGSLSPASPAGA